MNSIAERVKELLECACRTVYYHYPAAWSQLPCISWRESGNRELMQADGREALSEVTYTVDVWARLPAEVHEIGERVDKYFAAIRLRREYSADLYESSTGYHHKTMRYRAVIDPEGRIYQ